MILIFLRKKQLLALIAGLNFICCPIAHAEGSGIAEQLQSAFGNEDLFSSIADEFVNDSNASFSCKSWVMKARQQHSSDTWALNTIYTGKLAGPTRARAISQFQGQMVNFLLPSLNKACNP